MPFLVASVLRTNELFSGLETFHPDQLRTKMGGAETVLQIGENLELFNDLSEDLANDLKHFLGTIPASLDAALVAGVRNALGRDLRSQLTWQPGYEFELRVWEVSDGEFGLANFLLVTPHPEETVSA